MICARVVIATKKAKAQLTHRDCLDEGNFTVIVALTKRNVEFERVKIKMKAGDMLLFKADSEHRGLETPTSADTVGIILNYALTNTNFDPNTTYLVN